MTDNDNEIYEDKDEQTMQSSSSEKKLEQLDISKDDYKDTFDVLNSSLDSLSIPLNQQHRRKNEFKEKRDTLLNQKHIKDAIALREPIPYEMFETIDRYSTDTAEQIMMYQNKIIRLQRIPLKIIEKQLPQLENVKQMTEAMKSVDGLFKKYEAYMEKTIEGNNNNIEKQIDNESVRAEKDRLFYEKMFGKLMSNHEKNIETLSKGLLKLSSDLKAIKQQTTIDSIKLSESKSQNTNDFNTVVNPALPQPTISKDKNKDGIIPVKSDVPEEVYID